MSVEKEITRIAHFINYPIKGKLSYTEDNIIQMKIDENGNKIVGFSTISNYFHNNIQKDQTKEQTEEFYLTKQFFDYANIFIRSTSKRDKCMYKNIRTLSHFILNYHTKSNFYRCSVHGN